MQRLDKTLDAYEKATAVIVSKDQQIAAMKILDDLKNQWLAIKDQMIKAQAELITFYEKRQNSTRSKLRKLLETAGKVALVAAGILIGRGL